MAIIFGNATVPASTTGTFLFQVPPGPSAVTFYNPGAYNTVYLGCNTAVSLVVNGYPVPAGTTVASTPGFTASRGTGIYGATAGTASTFATTLQYILSTNA